MKQLTHRARMTCLSQCGLCCTWALQDWRWVAGEILCFMVKTDTNPWRVSLMWLQESKNTTNGPGKAMLSFLSCHWADKLAEYFMLDASQSHPQSSGFYKPNHKQKPNLGTQNLLRNQKRNINCQFFPKGAGRRGWIKEFYKMQSKSPHCLLHGKS